MAASTISLLSPVRRALAAAGCLLLVAGCAVAVVWGFANTIARNGKDKEFTEFAVGISPNDPQARFANAYQLEKTFDPADIERSLKEYEAAAALSPQNFLHWVALGQARERDGDRSAAEGAFRTALNLAPNYARTQWALGNNLVRQNKTDEGFKFIRGAIAQDVSFAAPAITAAIIAFGGDMNRIESALDRDPFVMAELAKRFATDKQMDESLAAWTRIPLDTRNERLPEVGKFLVQKFVEGKRFRFASDVAGSIASNPYVVPGIGKIVNGGFEEGVVLQNANAFDWQIGPGIYPQIALTDRNPKEGKFALAILFNSPSNLAFRDVSKTAALEPGTRYELRFAFRNETTSRAVFRWEIVSAGDGKSLAASEPLTGGTNWSESRVEFLVPADVDGITIKLVRVDCVSPQCTVSGNLFFDDFKLSALN